MEIKDTLKKPYTDKQRCDFIVENNHNKGYEIQETEEALLAIYNEPLPPTYEEVDQMRIEYRKEHIDDKTIARIRKTANGTWTDEDEQAYLELDTEVTAYIEEHFPYPVGE